MGWNPKVFEKEAPIMTVEERPHPIVPGVSCLYIVLSTPELTVEERLPDDAPKWNQEDFERNIPMIAANLAERFTERAKELEQLETKLTHRLDS